MLLMVAFRLLWTHVEPKIERLISQIGLTPNEVAANGPLPGDVSLYEKSCAAAWSGWVIGQYLKLIGEYQMSLEQYPNPTAVNKT